MFTPEGLHPSRGVAPSGFRPLRKFSTAASRRSLGSVSVPVMAGHALTPATRHSLGKLLPHQQADRPQAPPKAINLYSLTRDYQVLSRFLRGYS